METAITEPAVSAPIAVPSRLNRRLVMRLRPAAGELRHVIGVGALTLTVAAVYIAYLLVRYYNAQTGLFDLGIYDQAISNYAHFRGPHTPVLGLSSPTDLGSLQLADHFTPMLMVFVPFYWLHDAPTTLLVGTGLLVASAIPPIWLLTRRLLGTAAAYLVSVVYAVAWENQSQLWFAFHEVAFTAPIIAWMLERALAGKRRQAAAISLLLLLVKDDMGFVVAVFGLYLLFSKGFRREQWLDRTRLLGVGAMVVGGFAMVELVNKVLIPHWGGSPQRNWTYSEASSPGGLVWYIVTHPHEILYTLHTPEDKVETLRWLLEPLLFLPLLSRISLLALPLIVERFLSDNSMYWNTRLHYNAFLTVILLVAAVDGAARLVRWARRSKRFGARAGIVGLAWALGAAAVSLDTMSRWQMWEMTASAFWHSPDDPEVVAQRHAAAHVPDGALVASIPNAGTFLLSRTKVFVWTYSGEHSSVQPPWLLVDTKKQEYPWGSLKDQLAALKKLRDDGYEMVFSEGDYAVLHK